MTSEFRPAPWLRNPHLQTLWPVWFRRRRLNLVRERLELPDGDFLDLDWGLPRRGGALVVLFHGLEGSSNSHYAAGLLRALADAGHQGVVAHFRGCSGEPNRLNRAYSAGETGDPGYVLRHLAGRYPDRPLHAVGFSLGGNALMRTLGEAGSEAPVASAVAVSVPFLLDRAADRLESGFSRLYQGYLLAKLKASTRKKTGRPGFPLTAREIKACHSIREFDDRVTAPLHGYHGVGDYYARASSRQYLGAVRIPTLIIHSRDDPFMYADAIPGDGELAGPIRLEISEYGGHVGFIAGRLPGRPLYWLERRIVRWLATPREPESA